MTEHEARIEELVNTPPKVQWTARQRLVVLGIWILAMVGVVGMTVAIVKVSNVASCINGNLGQRSAPAAADAEAHEAFAYIVSIAVTKSLPSKDETDLIGKALGVHMTPGVFPTDTQILGAINAYPIKLVEHQMSRNAHPLGKC